jgi:Fibronectin type III domain
MTQLSPLWGFPVRVRLIGILSALIVALVGLVGISPAHAATTYPEFVSFDQTPSSVIFDAVNKHVELVVEMDDPVSWKLASAKLNFCNGYCGDESASPLKFTDQKRAAQRHWLTFEGTLNINRSTYRYGEVLYNVRLSYQRPDGAVVDVDSNSGSGQRYLTTKNDTKMTISGPSRIDTGSSLTLSGKITCYTGDGYKPIPAIYPPDYWGYANISYRLPGDSAWTYIGAAQVTQGGEWKYVNLSVGATADWQATYYHTRCADAVSPILRVNAGAGEPPTPPAHPSAPGVTVGEVTDSTVALNWTPASGEGITGYRFGWVSSNGKPVPSWSNEYPTTIDNPFVMTNLNPNTRYTMYIEALSTSGTGARASVVVTTKDAGKPPTHVKHPPSAPSWAYAYGRSHTAHLGWHTPTRHVPSVDLYQVYRSGKSVYTHSRTYVAGSLTNGRTYTFYVRAHNKDGWGPFSRGAAVRPHR